MSESYEIVYKKLLSIYDIHRRKYKTNPNSKQMCCMWSTNNPPDILEGTSPLSDIEKAFKISIDEDIAVDLYDMNIAEAATKIMEIQKVYEAAV